MDLVCGTGEVLNEAGDDCVCGVNRVGEGCACPETGWEIGGLCVLRTGDFEGFSQEELCEAFGGDAADEGAGRVCKGLDEAGTFCVLGSETVFPCRGVFKSLRFCNARWGRVLVNPFVCGRECGEGGARGMGCVQ